MLRQRAREKMEAATDGIERSEGKAGEERKCIGSKKETVIAGIKMAHWEIDV